MKITEKMYLLAKEIVCDYEQNNSNFLPLINKKEKVIIYNDPVVWCYNDCLEFFPQHLHPKKENTWLDTIDKLNRLDKVPFEHIVRITKLAREDEFISKKIFQSLPKLRQKPRGEEIYWITKWSENFKPSAKQKSASDILMERFQQNQ
jgi:hypothetical protein